MSRVAKAPIKVPGSVQVDIDKRETGIVVTLKGPKGEQSVVLHDSVAIELTDDQLLLSPRDKGEKKGSNAWAHAGTARALVANGLLGVEKAFEKRLQLKGVGYRAQAKGQVLNLTVGYSHPVELTVPAGIKAETPSQTEIVLTGINKQELGQFAANVRSVRPPEPYKGKGIRYADEHVRTKEAKKK